MEKVYLTPTEAMAYLSVSRNTLKKMVRLGMLPEPARLGSRLMRFDRSEIDRYLRGVQYEKDADLGRDDTGVQD
jgi:excisionase family DNA binding protein